MQQRAQRLAGPFAWVAVLAVLGFFIWTHVLSGRGVLPNPVQVMAFLLAVAAAWAVRDGYTGWAFAATTAAIAATMVSIFVSLYPNVMVSSTNSAYNLTVANALVGHYALTVMTVVAVIFTPLVLAYQGWSYYVFRARIRGPAAEAESGRGPWSRGRRPNPAGTDYRRPAPSIHLHRVGQDARSAGYEIGDQGRRRSPRKERGMDHPATVDEPRARATVEVSASADREGTGRAALSSDPPVDGRDRPRPAHLAEHGEDPPQEHLREAGRRGPATRPSSRPPAFTSSPTSRRLWSGRWPAMHRLASSWR